MSTALVERTARPANEPLLDENQFCEFVGIEPATARNWRWAGRGPRYIKVGKLVKYRASDVEKWLTSNTVGGQSK